MQLPSTNFHMLTPLIDNFLMKNYYTIYLTVFFFIEKPFPLTWFTSENQLLDNILKLKDPFFFHKGIMNSKQVITTKANY